MMAAQPAERESITTRCARPAMHGDPRAVPPRATCYNPVAID